MAPPEVPPQVASPDAHGGGVGSAHMGGVGNLDAGSAEEDASAAPDAATSTDVAEEPEVEPVMQKYQTAILKEEIKAVRKTRKAAKRASYKAKSLDYQAQSLGYEIKGYRFARLDKYAREQGWSPDKMPEKAQRDRRILRWWDEWRRLRTKAGVGAAGPVELK